MRKMRKIEKKLLSLTMTMMMVLSLASINVNATAGPAIFTDIGTITPTVGATNFNVEYALTDNAYSFVSVKTTINGHELSGTSASETITTLGLTPGTYTANYDITVETAGPNQQGYVVSGTGTSYETGSTPATAPASVLSFIHNAWNSTTASFSGTGAQWIWNNDPVIDPLVDEIVNFIQTFNINGDLVGNAQLMISSDNEFLASVNGQSTTYGPGGFSQAYTYDVTNDLVSGSNTLNISAKNYGLSGSTPATNPAGLIFALTYEVATTVQVDYTGTFEFTVPEPETPEEEANLWISSDDGADVYIDGEFSATNTSYNHATEYLIKNSDPFFAAKAWDTNGTANIAGFKLVFDKGDGSYISTDSTWYYYYDSNGDGGSNEPADDAFGHDWNDEDYVGEGWLPVTAYTLAEAPTPRNWAPDSDFPDSAAKWIWSPNFDVPSSDTIDTPVYLRSMAPKTLYTVSFDTAGGSPTPVNQDVIGGHLATEPEEAPVRDGFEFAGWDYNFTTPVNGNITITALWEPTEPTEPNPTPTPTPTPAPTTYYDLTVQATEGGTVPGFIGTSSFSSGTNVNLDPVAEEGYEFTGWTGDVNNNVVIMNSDKTVTANFELIVPEEEVPEATPEVTPEAPAVDEEILDTDIPEAGPSEDIEDEALPQTGGIPMGMMSLAGLSLAGFGMVLRKKK